MKKFTTPFSEKLAFKCLPTRIYGKQNNRIYFHLKQALFRKLKKLLPQEPDIYLMLRLMETLTLVPKREINDAIDFINF
ncbi:hypothetical protein HZS_5495 [Henneguya salminicola]|nr:hypothetical protein HZS_5495 [Henneguya salminicola]